MEPDPIKWKGRKLRPDEFTVEIKERRIKKTEYLRYGEVINPLEFELDPNYGYRPKRSEYDDMRNVVETVTSFPVKLEPYSYAEVIVEILDSDGEPLRPGGTI